MKRILIISIVLLSGLAFSGCQKKSTVSISSTTATAVPDALEQINSGATTSPTSATSQTTKEDSFILDTASIDSTFTQNYQVALEDAQKALKSSVKYCGAKITFYGATLSQANKQSFIFYSNDFSNDYYWVVMLNGYQDNKKSRAFAAKKDLATELKCMTSTGSAPGTFSGIYEQLTKTEQFKKVDPGTIAETTLETLDSSWNVTVINNAGESVIVNTLNSSAKTTSSSQASTSTTAVAD